ncbi:MAG: SGNH/GDSL hydrolase family protein [Microbacterium sp.]|uniref:SGNH/GDSL hydrolase family protein n=1 Tax=Microbacterium sp. TaxID=51671 RepID=UPI001AC947D2|nr:SGNH/GDSL hydrolase family protein [Microbacterium sp.]MBN9176135.1 SGNH/GDSL hydrolase family protein [Microbacterium sp.]
MWLIVSAVVAIVAMVGFGISQMPRTTVASTHTPRPSASFDFSTPTPTPTPTAAPLVLPPPGSTAMFVGDSWTFGQSVDDTEGYVPIVADAFGWVAANYGEQGTGYTQNRGDGGTLYPDRIPLLPIEPPSIIILQGGLNDEGSGSVEVREAAKRTIDGLNEKYPGVPIVVIGPSTAVIPVTPSNANVSSGIRAAAQAKTDVYFISPQDESWFNAQNISTVIGADNHPSADGYRVFAERLITDLNTLAG